MAVYKVPQDVEAEDKLIGPFSFRQFIYLGIVAMTLAAAWGLFLLFPLLSVIPLPLSIFFGALALPLRKDQPMETYLAAMWQFYIKPRRRMWMADGVVSRITIDVPQVVERQLVKDITTDQAISQFDYLSQIADSGGWSTRGVTHAPMAVVDNPGEDILDADSSVGQNFGTKLQQEDDQRREDLLAQFHSQASAAAVAPQSPAPSPIIEPPVPPAYSDPLGQSGDDGPAPVYSPAPQYMQQHVIQPFDPNHKVPAQPTTYLTPRAKKPAESAPSAATPAIMELAKGVSVETVAKQLHHEEVERNGDEIVINLH